MEQQQQQQHPTLPTPCSVFFASGVKSDETHLPTQMQSVAIGVPMSISSLPSAAIAIGTATSSEIHPTTPTSTSTPTTTTANIIPAMTTIPSNSFLSLIEAAASGNSSLSTTTIQQQQQGGGMLQQFQANINNNSQIEGIAGLISAGGIVAGGENDEDIQEPPEKRKSRGGGLRKSTENLKNNAMIMFQDGFCVRRAVRDIVPVASTTLMSPNITTTTTTTGQQNNMINNQTSILRPIWCIEGNQRSGSTSVNSATTSQIDSTVKDIGLPGRNTDVVRILLSPNTSSPVVPSAQQADLRVFVVSPSGISAKKWGVIDASLTKRVTGTIYPHVIATGTVGRLRVPQGRRDKSGLGVVNVELLEFNNGHSIWVETCPRWLQQNGNSNANASSNNNPNQPQPIGDPNIVVAAALEQQQQMQNQQPIQIQIQQQQQQNQQQNPLVQVQPLQPIQQIQQIVPGQPSPEAIALAGMPQIQQQIQQQQQQLQQIQQQLQQSQQ